MPGASADACAESQNRTGDTAIFSRVLYQLSYLGPIDILPAGGITVKPSGFSGGPWPWECLKHARAEPGECRGLRNAQSPACAESLPAGVLVTGRIGTGRMGRPGAVGLTGKAGTRGAGEIQGGSMTEEVLEQTLREAKDTRQVVIERGALSQTHAVLQRWFGDQAAFLVADANTLEAAGKAVEQDLTDHGRALAGWHVFSGKPRLHPNIEHVDELVHLMAPHQAVPLAIGSGVINDLTKLAAHRLGRPYAVVATAASMDGYTAFAAAITHQGVKKVDTCPAPRVLVADLDILAAAPAGMSASGYADLLGKYTAIADWQIAHDLGIESIEPVSWRLMRDGLPEWTSDPEGIGRSDPAALRRLVEGLVMAGLAMQISNSTRPASGSEHLFSHLWEMQGLQHQAEPVSHGFQVGLGTLAVTALLDWFRDREMTGIPVDRLVAAWPSRQVAESEVRASHPAGAQADQAADETLAKYLSAEELANRLRRVQACWPGLLAALTAWCLPATEIRRRLAAAGCPTTPEAISLTRQRLREAYTLARQVRKRYTVLDLAIETGTMQPALHDLFGSTGFWGSGLPATHA